MERIVLQNITKKFNITGKKNQGFLINLLSAFSCFWKKKTIGVLKDVSLKIKSGEIVGIIGANGSGKSTLLRITAGIYKPSSGSIRTNGRIISLINLFVGLKDRLTMKENIFLIGSLFGMNQKDIKIRLNSIIEFSGVGNFVNTKIYQFSNGMMQRLVFSIAVHSNPDILLLDEVFEFGDEEFSKKSAKKIQEIVSTGACVISVTHDLEVMIKYCSRIIWLDNGEIKEIGNPEEIIKKYCNRVYKPDG